MKVLISGITGNLGSYLKQRFEQEAHEVIACPLYLNNIRAKSLEATLKELIDLKERPDLIINATGAYLTDTTPGSRTRMTASILDTGRIIIDANNYWKAPLVNFSSYFQFAPVPIENYSQYILIKDQLSQYLKTSSTQYGFPSIDFILYDNFGGHRRSKFLETLIDRTASGSIFEVSSPKTKINLVHVDSVYEAIIKYYEDKHLGWERYQIRAQYDNSLGEICELVAEISNKKSIVHFLDVEARIPMVERIWDCAQDWIRIDSRDALVMFIKNELTWYDSKGLHTDLQRIKN